MSEAARTPARGIGRRVRSLAASLLLLVAGAVGAQAQVQRSFVNPGFELPNLGGVPCRVYISDTQVPGWLTSHPLFAYQAVGTCNVADPGPSPGRIIEIWRGPRDGISAREGVQFAELNAEQSSRISQVMCLVGGDQVSWAFSHRGRSSATIQDVMHFLLGNQEVVRVGTTNDGSGGVVSTTLGTSATTPASGGWRDYSGSFTYSGAGGPLNFGFGSLSTGGGNIAFGNFIDDIRVAVAPFVELSSTKFSSLEGVGYPAGNLPTLRISGVVSTPLQVEIALVALGSTATHGDDFTTPGGGTTFTVTVPAGDYGAGTEVPIGFTAIDDGTPEGAELVVFELSPPAPGDGYLIDSTRVCGGSAVTAGEWTIYDNSPALALEKTAALVDANNNGAADPGDTITYSFTLTNIGSVALTDVVVNDPRIGAVPGSPIASLAIGASQTLTASYPLSAGDIGAGEVENTATAEGTPPGGGPPVPSNPSSVTVPLAYSPGLTIAKSGVHNDGNRGFASVGDVVTYSFVVTNTGNVALTNVTVTDSWFPSIAGSPLASLPAGASRTLTATHLLTQANINAGAISNTADVVGTPPAGPSVGDTDTAVTPLVQAPRLALVKTAGAPSAQAAGGTIPYTFRVTNTGNVPIENLSIDDPQLVSSAVCGTTTLAIGASTDCTGSHVITQEEMDAGVARNSARAAGETGAGTPAVSPPAATTTPLQQRRAMAVAKSVDLATVFAAGTVLNYTIEVRNTGTVSLSPISIADTLPDGSIAGVAGPSGDGGVIGVLEPGELWTYTASYTVTPADIAAGDDLVNHVVVAAPGLSPQDIAVTTVTTNPSMAVAKDVDVLLVDASGTVLTYTIAVENTGNLPLSGIAVVDTLPDGNSAGVAGPFGDGDVMGVLDPGETWTYTVTYVVSLDDLNAGTPLVNAVSVTSEQTPDPVTDIAVTGVRQIPAMAVEKQVDQSAVAAPDTVLTYTITVANTGNVTLTDVAVTDLLPGAVAPIPVAGPDSSDADVIGELDPGETWTYILTHSVTQPDLDAGIPLVNTATVTALTPGDVEIEGTDGATTLITRNPRIDVKKTVDQTALIAPGPLTYTITLRNIGNVAVGNLSLVDTLPDGTEGVLTGPLGDSNTNGLLDVGEIWTYSVDFAVGQPLIDLGDDIVNSVAVSTPDIPATVTDPIRSTAKTEVQRAPSLTVSKQVDTALMTAPGPLAYNIRVTNTGNVTLTGVAVVDTLPDGQAVTLSAVPGGDTIPVGEFRDYTVTYEAGQTAIDAGSFLVNRVSVTGNQTPDPVSDEAETAIARYPALSVVKSGTFVDVDANGFTNAGDRIRYSFTVLNEGNVTLTAVTPLDPGPSFAGAPGTGTLSAITPVPPPAPVTLGPGESREFTAEYTLSQADVNAAAGEPEAVENTAIATGLFDGDEPVQSFPYTALLSIPGQEPPLVSLVKRAQVNTVRRGETVAFVIEASNNSTGDIGLVSIVDRLPPAFDYVAGSATLDGVPVTPLIEGREIRFPDVPLGPNAEVTIRLVLRALPTITPGRYTNVATLFDDGGEPLAPPAEASVDVLAEAVFDCSEVIGTVFNDRNRNGYQNQGEPGLPGVRLATVRGTLITTDAFGRYSVPCADLPNQTIGSNFVLKLDDRTLPTGFGLTTRNPAMARLTAGKMTEINFGASIGRQVRIDLDASAFARGSIEPGRALAAALDNLVTLLAGERSALLVVFNDAAGGGQAQARLANLRAVLLSRWQRLGAPYDLTIETRIIGR